MVKIKREISKTCTEVVFISLTLYFTMNVNALKQGPPTPWPRISSSPWSVRNRAAQREVSGGRASEASSAVPHRSHYRLNTPSDPTSPPRQWKNCLPQHRSLVPKRLVTAALYDGVPCFRMQYIHWIKNLYILLHPQEKEHTGLGTQVFLPWGESRSGPT